MARWHVMFVYIGLMKSLMQSVGFIKTNVWLDLCTVVKHGLDFTSTELAVVKNKAVCIMCSSLHGGLLNQSTQNYL